MLQSRTKSKGESDGSGGAKAGAESGFGCTRRRTAASQLAGVSTRHPDSCGPGSGAAIFAEQAGDSFFLSSKGSATGEFAGVFLACNQKIQFYD